MIINRSEVSIEVLRQIEAESAKHKTLGDVLNWTATKPKRYFVPQIVAEVITQDEFTHDVIVPYRDLFLVYDTT